MKPYQKLSGFIFIFFIIFGFKVGYLDLSVFVPFMVLCIWILSGRNAIVFNRKLIVICGLICLLLAYQIFLQIFLFSFDVESLFRLLRAAMICFLISAAVGSRLFMPEDLARSVFIAILLHTIFLIFAGLFPIVNYFSSQLSGNSRINQFRASGLLAGFDMSGLLCIIGAIIVLMRVYPLRSVYMAISLIVFFVGAAFSSRVSIGLLFILYLTYILVNARRQTNLVKTIALILFSLTIALFFLQKYLIPIIEVTYSLGYFDVDDAMRDSIVSRHAVQRDGSFLWDDMFFLPDSASGIIFGTGVDAPLSDVGFVKDIFRYGVLGLVFSLYIYSKIYHICRLGAENLGHGYILMIRVLFFLAIILSFKNNYLFTRAIFPLILLLVSIPIIHRSSFFLNREGLHYRQ